MKNLPALQADQQPTLEQLAFVLLGQPGNPKGGLPSRFDFTGLPSVGSTLPELPTICRCWTCHGAVLSATRSPARCSRM